MYLQKAKRSGFKNKKVFGEWKRVYEMDGTNEIKVSVIVPVFNAEYFLRPCLDSIMNQTLSEIEIICVDDGSEDKSLEILEEYRQKDSRFYLYQNKHTKNSGGGPARNMGIGKARGKYLAILDDDDFFEVNMLELAYCRAESMKAQIMICSDIWEYNHRTGKEVKVKNTQFFPERELFSGVGIAEYLFQITKGAAWRGLFLREFILEKRICFLDRDSIGADDLPFTYWALALADRITILRGAFVHHRLNTGENQSSRARISSFYNAFRKLKEVLEQEQLFGIYQNTFVNVVMRLLIPALNAQRYDEHFSEYYEMVKGEISASLKLSFYLELPVNKIYDLSIWREYKRIMMLSSKDYIAEKKEEAMIIEGYKLPEIINNSSLSIVLYGAGVYGKHIYQKIQQYSICKISRWVDQKYKEIGVPVQSPQNWKSLVFDYVLIAMIDEKKVQEVRQTLLDNGVEKNKILILEKI